MEIPYPLMKNWILFGGAPPKFSKHWMPFLFFTSFFLSNFLVPSRARFRGTDCRILSPIGRFRCGALVPAGGAAGGPPVCLRCCTVRRIKKKGRHLEKTEPEMPRFECDSHSEHPPPPKSTAFLGGRVS